jgi:RHS repeat-associated protein
VTVTCVPTADLPLCFISGQNVYFGKKLLVSNGVNVVTDRLGSVRANTQGEWFAYYPYGEERTSTVDGRDKFGTYFRDGVGQDYADQRYYGSGTGRFWSADPGGIKTAKPSRPSSWNRYAYVEGDPVNFADPHGTYLVDAGGGLILDCGYGADSIYDGTCTGTDGGWGGDDGGGGGCGSSMGSGFMEAPDPSPCPVDYEPPPPPSCSFSVIVEGGAAGYHLPFAYHTVIQVDYGNGIDIDYEALPSTKTAQQNPLHLPTLFGGSWLNKSQTFGNVQGTVVDSASGPDVCAEDAAITAAFTSWQNNTTSYYFYPQNSNSFAHWLLSQANVQIDPGAAFWMSNHVAGWSWNPAGQGN